MRKHINLVKQGNTFIMTPEKDPETTNDFKYNSPLNNLPAPDVAGVDTSLEVDSNGFVAEPAIDETSKVENNEPFQAQLAPSLRPKKSNKRLFILIAAAVTIVLLSSVSVFAFYYNTPDKSVSDAFGQMLGMSSLKSQGTLTVNAVDKTNPNVKMTYDLALNGTSLSADSNIGITVNAKTVTVKANAVTTKDAIAIKLTNFRDTANSLMGMIGLNANSLDPYSSLINKIDNKWVVITKDDLSQYSSDKEADTQATCAQDAIATFQANKSQQSEISNLYKNNAFVTVSKSLGTETINGKLSNHYELTVDDKKAQTFGDKLPSTTVFKAVDTCYKGDLTRQFNEANKTAATDSKTTGKTELWVDMVSHTATKFRVTLKDSTSNTVFESFLQVNSAPQIVVPKADTTLKDLQSEIQKLQQTTFGDIESSLNTSAAGVGTSI